MLYDATAMYRARAARRLAVPVAITCGHCGKECRDENGVVRTTRDRGLREDVCPTCRTVTSAHNEGTQP